MQSLLIEETDSGNGHGSVKRVRGMRTCDSGNTRHLAKARWEDTGKLTWQVRIGPKLTHISSSLMRGEAGNAGGAASTGSRAECRGETKLCIEVVEVGKRYN